METADIERFKELIESSGKVVFFGGAGVSVASGIPDFRSSDGIFNVEASNVKPEEILTKEYFEKHTMEFFKFYKEKMLYLDSEPNNCHRFLSELEKKGKLLGIITQNIDGLHFRAGNKKVIELHGSYFRNYCNKCGKSFEIDRILESEDIPECECGGIIKPDIVLYGDNLDNEVLRTAIELIISADLLIVAGTSLSVFPAAGLINYFKGKSCVYLDRCENGFNKLIPNVNKLYIDCNIEQIFNNLRSDYHEF